MAPQQSPSTSLQERLLPLVSTLQFAWFAGHVTLLLTTLRYLLGAVFFNFSSRAVRFSYRTAFVAATATYGIVVYKSFRARARAGKAQSGGASAVVTDENVQYLVVALVWLFSHQVSLALAPFAVYSIFHVATYTRTYLLPALSPAPASSVPSSAAGTSPGPAGAAAAATDSKPRSNSPLADMIGRFVKDHYDSSMTVVAILEILLWFRLLLPALLFYKGTWILLAAYTVFLRARYAQSSFVQGAFAQVAAQIDAVANRQDLPPQVRQTWATVKGLLHQAVQATDLGRLAGGQQGPVKKAQ